LDDFDLDDLEVNESVRFVALIGIDLDDLEVDDLDE
jgi:cytidylate kinase